MFVLLKPLNAFRLLLARVTPILLCVKLLLLLSCQVPFDWLAALAQIHLFVEFPGLFRGFGPVS